MSEETDTQPEEIVEAAPEAKEEPRERHFSQDEVSALLAREAAKLKRKLRREFESQSQSVQNQETPSQEQTSELEFLRQEMANNREILQKLVTEKEADKREVTIQAKTAGLGLNDEQMSIARSLPDEQLDLYLKPFKEAGSPPEPKGPGYQSPGAPNPTPSADKSSPLKWGIDDINKMRQEGTF